MMTSRTPSPASRWTSSYSFEPCFFLEAQTCGLGWTRMSALSISPLCSIEDIEVIPCVDDLKFSGLPTPNVTWASLSFSGELEAQGKLAGMRSTVELLYRPLQGN